jgi:hypothetical protein
MEEFATNPNAGGDAQHLQNSILGSPKSIKTALKIPRAHFVARLWGGHITTHRHTAGAREPAAPLVIQKRA